MSSIRILLLVVALTLTMPISGFLPNGVEADPSALVVNVRIDQDLVPVDVSPGSTGTATLTGVCEAFPPPALPVVVSLNAMCTVGAATVSPQSFTLTSSAASQELSISVRVPLLTPVSETPVVSVSGSYTSGPVPGNIAGDSASLVVLPFYELSLNSSRNYTIVSAGSDFEMLVRVSNTGNAPDQAAICVQCEQALEQMGITIEPSVESIALDYLQISTVTFDIRTSKFADVGLHKVVVEFLHGENQTKVCIFTVRVGSSPLGVLAAAASNPLIIFALAVFATVSISSLVIWRRRRGPRRIRPS